MIPTQEVLFSIFDGRALLFLGAGFSRGAKSMSLKEENKEEDFPSGDELANELMQLLGETNERKHPLDRCAGLFEAKRLRSGLLATLARRLKVTKIAEFQETILSCPWNRIYTTNYDDIVSRANCLPKKLRRIGLDDDIPHYTNSTIECLYINGYLNMEYPESSNIVITRQDYASPNNTRREEFIRTFRTDVSMVDNVFFLGYSVYDIEVAKILQEDTSIKRKIFFVTGPSLDSVEEEEIARYGMPINLSCSDFSQHLKIAKKRYDSLPHTVNTSFFSFSRYEISQDSENHSTDAVNNPVFSLITRSNINRHLLKNSLFQPSVYALTRDKLETIVTSVNNGTKVVIIHSHMCNGKTILIEEIAAYLSEFYPVYFAKAGSKSLNRDIIGLSKENEGKRVVVIIDGYARAYYEISPIIKRLDNLIFILSERSAIHRMLHHKGEYINGAEIYSVDEMSESEIPNFITLLKDNGITGLSRNQLATRIVHDYGRTIGKTILCLLEESELSNRIISEMKKVLDIEQNYRKEAYAIIMLSIILGERIEKRLINEILDTRSAYTENFANSSLFHDMLVIDEDTVYCPGALAYVLAKKVFDPEFARQIILCIAKFAYRMRHIYFYEMLSTSSMRYSILQRILPNEAFLSNTTLFYTELRNIGGLGDFPLFWLQFAIANLNQKKFPIAKTYLETAYQLARSNNFNEYQIDNQYAKLLLVADESISIEPFERFCKARELLLKQLNELNDKYVYRAAGGLATMRHYFNNFSIPQLRAVKRFIEVIIQKEKILSDDTKREVRFDMERIIDAKRTIDALLPVE